MPPSEPPQPPKEAAYTQPENPISQIPTETHQQAAHEQEHARHHGDPVPAISRTAASLPSNDEALARLNRQRDRRRGETQAAAPGLDTEYGVEQQPAEGEIAAAVEGKTERLRARMQAGAHAGAVGGGRGPGAPAQEGTGTVTMMSELDRKTEEHEQVLGERVGRSPAQPGSVEDERERVRRQKLGQERNVDVKKAVSEATGSAVVGG